MLRFVSLVTRATLPITMLLACTSSAWAQADQASQTDAKSWPLGYVLTVMAIILGMITVCRLGRRSTEIKDFD